MYHRNRTTVWLPRAAVALSILVLGTTVVRAGEMELVSALTALKDHIQGTTPLDATQIENHKATIDANKTLLGSSETVIATAFDLVETYDTVIGPLFVSGSPVQSFKRSTAVNDIHWTIYHVMQYIMDYTYTTDNIAARESLIDGFKFESSAHFPGAAEPPPDPQASHTVTVDGTYLDPWGHDVMHEERPARRPTGTYLAPGTIATVTVPSSITAKGYQVRIGAHSWDFSNKPTVKRLDRSSRVYNIDSTQIKVASPLGGGIYIEVPENSEAGLIDVQIKNAIRSPFFSTKSFHNVTQRKWQLTERNQPGPWADFESDKFMMQVPTDWLYKLDDPVTLMEKWDKAIDLTNNLMGFPEGCGREAMYQQVDLFIRSSAYAPGYPTLNATYNPNSNYGGNANHYLIKGPEYVPDYVFHEAGHGYLFVKFPGETESAVNLLHVAVWHQGFGYDLDYAFAASRGYQSNPNRTLDNTAVTWMTSFNFSPREVPMADGEKAYQLKGHAKFVDTARLFGWEGLNAFWYSINEDYENGITWSRHGSDIDDLILRWCESVGVDLRPLFHFWGTPPVDAQALAAAIATENLQSSAAIYDTLIRYRSLVPADNQAFRDFALAWWGHQPSIDGNWTEREHARQWDEEPLVENPELPNGEIYDAGSCARIKARLNEIIDLYFPEGRPCYSVDAGVDMITWSGQAVQLAPVVEDHCDTPAVLTYAWTVDPAEGVVFDPPAANVQTPTVTITKPVPGPLTITLTLTVTDVENQTVRDAITIEVYDNACEAALAKGPGEDHPTDLNGDCVTNLGDFVLLAEGWLSQSGLTEPVVKPEP